jgi:hypothetical protein
MVFTTKYTKKPSKKIKKYAEGGAVEYPKTDDNRFFASGADEKIIRAKRTLRNRLETDADKKTADWPGINQYLDAETTREIADDVRGRVRRPPGGRSLIRGDD